MIKYFCDSCVELIEGDIYEFVSNNSYNLNGAIKANKKTGYVVLRGHFCSPECMGKWVTKVAS